MRIRPLLFDTRAQPTGDALQKCTSTVAGVARVIYNDDSPSCGCDTNWR
ncbi:MULTISPECIES: hypothetical protein [unclassified Rathayibacter]|nr:MULTISPECIES: hypothetical protein [unclassified Rathayibacter]MCJ1705502.1 hypothetical protein [Rathayibacter sp. VKM Ac-2926]